VRVCIVGASRKLGQYMVQHALDRGYEVVGVCREQSVGKLDAFKGRITVVPGATDDREVIKRAVAGCGGVLVVLVPRGCTRGSSRRSSRSAAFSGGSLASLISTIRWRCAGGYSRVTHGGPSCAAATSRRARARACPCGAGTWATPSSRATATRRVDFALFMVEALKNDELVHEAPAIVGRQTPSALTHAAGE
jgi:hypothetical protein